MDPGDPLRRTERRISEALAGGRLAPEDARVLRKLKDGIQSARFAPSGRAGAAEVIADAVAALARVENGARRWQRRLGILGVLAMVGAAHLESQTQPEQFYEAGAYRSAAEGFRARALAAPATPAHWLNLGAAAYRAGDDALALVAWVRAARLSPRDGAIRRALLMVPPSDDAANSALWVSPVTPAELWLLGLLSWLAGWGGILWSRRWGGRWLVLVGAGMAVLALAAGLQRWYDRPVAIADGNQQLRLSPHELAPAVGEVPRLGLVLLGRVRGQWVTVDNGNGQQGWIPRNAVQPLSGTGAP